MAVNFPSNPTNGDTLTVGGITYAYDSTQGVWSDNPQGLTQAIDALTDVDTSTSAPSDGQVLQWNSTDSEWQPADAASGVTVYATIDDLPLTGVTEGSMALVDSTDKLYIYSDTGWYSISIVNQTPTISGVNATYALATDGTATTVTVTATDPEGIPLTYSIVSDTSGSVATVAQGTGSNTNQWTITPSTNTADAGNFNLVFRASDGTNIASASSTFTLAFGPAFVQDSNYTTALITSVGANNAVNNSFSDASTNNHTITAYGNVTQNTFSPYRHGGYSTYFDGSGDYIALSNFVSNYGNLDFTVEVWIYPTAVGSRHNFGDFNSSGQNASSSLVFKFDNDKAKWWIQTSTYNSIVSAASISANAWTHIALVRNGSTITQYINGSSDGTLNVGSANINQSSITYTLGTGGDYRADYYQGYLSDFRVVKGTAVYTSAFTPPTERLTAITNTSLLTCHLPYIADGSTNNHSITVNGDTKTEPFAPYENEEYDEADHGGSMYFDGSGDYLTTPSIQLGTSPFTIEMWVNLSTVTTSSNIPFLSSGTSSSAGTFQFEISSNNKLGFQYDAASTFTTSSGLTANTWHHVAIVRETLGISDTNMYLDGVLVGSSQVQSDFNSTADIFIGRNRGNSTYVSGYISDVRITKGTAVYTSAFTPPTAPLTAITNTSLLLNGTDAGIIDKSQSVKTITLNGNVKSSTAQTKYLTSSVYFDGTGDYLSIEPSDQFNFGSGDFTIEAWFYATAAASGSDYHIVGYGSSGTSFWAIRIRNNTDRGLEFRWFEGSEQLAIYQGSDFTATNQWHHVAVTRGSNAWRMFLNGTQVASGISNSGTISDFTNSLQVGALPTVTGANFAGYISDVRITKGLARYTSNFTPPSAALEG